MTAPHSSGATRARTGRNTARSSAGSGSGSGSCTRDWADVGGDGPAGLIAERALAGGGGVADYVRFRAVCRAWRRCAPDPRGAAAPGGLDDARFLPRNWIVLDSAAPAAGLPRRHRFLNVSTGECVRTDLPELAAAHRLLALTPEGLLLLLDRATLAVRLLNPLTRRLTDLPPVTTLLTPAEAARGRVVSGVDLRVHSAGLVAGASAVAVSFSFLPSHPVLAVAKPGDEGWTAVPVPLGEHVSSTLPFAGGLYCANSVGVMALDVSSSGQRPPRLQLVAYRSASAFYCSPSGKAHSLHLVDNGGELLLVHRDTTPPYVAVYKVYRVDLEAGTLVRVRSLNGRAVFMGMRRAISVSPEVFPSVAADTIYLALDCDSQTLGYNVADGSREPRRYESILRDGCVRVGPDGIVECLCYCIHGVGNML